MVNPQTARAWFGLPEGLDSAKRYAGKFAGPEQGRIPASRANRKRPTAQPGKPLASSDFLMVGGTGLEPVNGYGHAVDGVRTTPGQIEDNRFGTNGLEEQTGDILENTGDMLANKSCCTCVASSDVARLLQAWQAAPEWARKVTLNILEGASADRGPMID